MSIRLMRTITNTKIILLIISICLIISFIVVIQANYLHFKYRIVIADVMLLMNGIKTPLEEYISSHKCEVPSDLLEKIGAQTSKGCGKYSAVKNVVMIDESFLPNEKYYPDCYDNMKGKIHLQAIIGDRNGDISGKTIRFTLHLGPREWTCSKGSPNGIDNKYLPEHCRNSLPPQNLKVKVSSEEIFGQIFVFLGIATSSGIIVHQGIVTSSESIIRSGRVLSGIMFIDFDNSSQLSEENERYTGVGLLILNL